MFQPANRRRGTILGVATLPIAVAMVLAAALAAGGPARAGTGLAGTGLAGTGLAGTGLAGTGQTATGLAGTATARTKAPRTLPGTHPAWATAYADRGAVSASREISAQVYLAVRDPAGLASYAQAVAMPKSARYHHYLTARQQDAAYGPTQTQISRVRSWLTRAGLKITASTEQYLAVTGPARSVRRAFGAQLRNYALSGHVYYAPDRTARVPAALVPAVLGVAGLDDAPRPARPAATPASPPASRVMRPVGGPPYAGLSPCSSYWGQRRPAGLPGAYGHSSPLPVCGYTPGQLRAAYGVAATGLTGRGVTVAVVDAYGSPTIEPDVDTFDRLNHVPRFARGQFSQVVTPSRWNSQGACGGPAGWRPEEALDIEAVHTMAPAARVLYVGANSCQDSDFLSAFADIVDHHLATIVSDSWDEDLSDYGGDEPASNIRAYTQLFQEGAAEGIGFYFASGDCSTDDPSIVNGGLNCDANSSEPQVTFPSSDQWVTAVGATAIGIGSHGDDLFETGMGDSEATLRGAAGWSSLPGTFLFGGGGGTSDYFTQPFYQRAVVPDSLSHTLLTGARSATAMREVPDVAMEGDLFAGTMVGFTRTLPGGAIGWAQAGYGGTSVACPLLAAVQADAQQAGHFPIGFANPEIYSRYQLMGQGAFRDIVDQPRGQTFASVIEGVGSGQRQARLFTLGTDWTLHAKDGFDDVTGVGSPTAAYLESFR